MIVLWPHTPEITTPPLRFLWWWNDSRDNMPPAAEVIANMRPQIMGKTLNWVNRLATKGHPFADGENVKRLEDIDLLYETRPFPARVMFLLDGNDLVILHAFEKYTDDTPPEHLRKAMQRRDAYMEHKRAKRVEKLES